MKKIFFLTALLCCAVATKIFAQAQNQRQRTEVDWALVGYALGEMETMDVDAVREAFDAFKDTEGYDLEKYLPLMDELEQWGSGVPNNLAAGDQGALRTALRKINLRRQILLSNPLLDPDRIIVGRYQLGGGAPYVMAPQLGTQPNNWSNQSSGRKNGFDAEIAILSNLRGDLKDVKVTTVYKPDNGAPVTDMQLHWDADRMLFTSVDKRGKWNVFEVGIDGKGLRNPIECDEPDLEFMDGGYLPSGTILAMSNIGYQGVPCVNGDDQVGNMISYNPATKELRRMTFDQDANWHPRVMNNGQLMYVRWEYTDLTHYYARFVMHANPDGTETKALYGSGGWFPNAIFDVQPLPGGTSSFVGVISGHHGTARSGRLMIFDPAKGRKELAGIVQEMPFRNREIIPLIKDELVDGVWPQFIKPWPLSDQFFLVSAKMDRNSPWGIYLIDVFDNVTLLAQFEGEGLINPIMVTKRATPPVIPDRYKPNEKDATFFIQDIYQGEGLPGVPVGTVKQLRIFAYEYCYVRSPSDHTAQGVQSGWDIKRLLGTVDVEKDGSVMFKAPANTPISIQPLDEEGRALQWMRSWVTGMPGEIVSCVGCHEDQNSVPIPKRAMASLKAPVPLTPPEGGVRPFTYELEVQPILDRTCVSCHNERSRLDLRGGRKEMNMASNKKSDTEEMLISKSYLALHPFTSRQGPEADIYVMKPYEYHASTSELVRILKGGHYGVELTDDEWRTLYTWIDFNVPYHGAFVYNSLNYCPTNQYERRIELANKYGYGAGVEWKKEIADYAAYLEAKGPVAPATINRPARNSTANATVAGWPFTPEQAQAMIAGSDARKTVEISPGVEINFVRIPAGKFVMGNNSRGANNSPASVVEIEKPFWMAETELTNVQYNAVFPQHDSRYIAMFWKDHVNPGYPANRPDQPVIRVTWNEAMEYCRKLGEKTGLNINLPTEAQWEWACRAGSDKEMWYGTTNNDFAGYDNLADYSLRDMAVTGVDPKPMRDDNSSRPYWDFIPKEASVNDGNMIVGDVKQYAPNPWGLYDMHGNVAELTRSDFVPYPYSGSVGQGEAKVVRGGSWMSRPKNATSYSRDSYLAWQPGFLTGFRLVIED